MKKEARSGDIRHNGGFFLPLLLVVSAIIVMLAMQRLFFARGTLHHTQHMARHEVAYQAASGSVRAAQALVEEFIHLTGGGPVADKNSLRERFGDLLDLLDDEGNLNLAPAECEINTEDLVWLRKQLVPTGSLDVTLSLRTVKTVPRDGEGDFELLIQAVAHYEGAKSTVTARSEGRRIFTHLVPFGKFTLFVMDGSDFNMDALRDSERPERIEHLPAVIRNGDSAGNKSFSAKELAEFLDKQGFIYLGGDDWQFGLTMAGRDQRYMDAGLPDEMHLFPVPGLGPTEVQAILGRPLDFRYTARFSPLYRECLSMDDREALKHSSPAQASFSSLLNLFGSAADPSPTVVFGNVARRYLLIQGVQESTAGIDAPLPYLPRESDFHLKIWPGNNAPRTIDFFYQNFFHGKFEEYTPRMSQPMTDSYNRSHLTFLNETDFPRDQQDCLLPEELKLEALQRIHSNGYLVLPDRQIPAGTFDLQDADGKALFSGRPESWKAEEYLEPRVTFRHSSGEEFLAARMTKDGLTLRGVEQIDGSLVINRPLKLAPGAGGILAVEGDIRINSRITTADSHLYLLSLHGTIRVDTTEPVQAYLAAPEHDVRLKDGFTVDGGIMMKRLPKDFFSRGRRPKSISWNQRYDFTDSRIRQRGYRTVIRPQWEYHAR